MHVSSLRKEEDRPEQQEDRLEQRAQLEKGKEWLEEASIKCKVVSSYHSST